MKIKLKEAILDYENKPVEIPSPTEENPDKTKTLTYFDVFSSSLNSQVGNEIISAETKAKIYQISKKIYDSNEPNFTADQLLLIKERVGKAYSAMVYGKVCDLIDGIEEPKASEKAAETEAPAETPAN